jgi:RecA/RadA recombinase
LLGLAGRLGADIAPFALAAAVSEFGILPPEPDAQRVNGAALRTPPITFHRYQRDNNPYGGQRWLIHGMLPETGVAFLAGMYGSGKTFVGLDMAVSVVSGAPFAGYDVERQGGVLFLAAEGAAEIPVRLRARLGSDVDQIPFLWRDDVPVMLAPGGQSALVAATVAAAAEFAKEGLPLSLVILDTIAAAAGWTNENDAAEAAAAIRVLKAMADAAGCLVLAIDHHGKTAESGQRGSSAKAAGAESVLSVLCDREQNGTVTNRRLALHKVRAAPAGREVSFDLQQVTIGEDVKGRPVTTCVVDWQDRGTTATVDRMSRAATAALGILGELIEANRGEPVPENTWRDECEDRRISAAEDRKSRSRAFTRAFEGLRDTGRVLAGAGLVGMKPRAAAEFNDTTVVTFAKGTGDKRGTMSPFAPCHPPHMGDKGPMGQGNVPFVPLTVAGNLNLAQSELRQLLS